VTALAAGRGNRERKIRFLQFLLATGVVAFPGASVFWDPAQSAAVIGVSTAAATTSNLRFLGICVEPISVTGDGTKKINVDLKEEVTLTYFVNGTAGDAVASTDLFNTAYTLDDQTCSILGVGKAPLGIIFDVDTVNGIGVSKFNALNAITPLLNQPSGLVFTANALAPATVQNLALYEVPTTAGVSTITLPTAAPDGTLIFFHADGVKNGHTVQFLDQTGARALSVANVASKSFLAVCAKRNGKWAVTVTSAP
jgi:hypothetical protein